MNATNVDLNLKIAQLFQLYKSLENTTNVALTSLKPRSQREKRILNSDVNNLLQVDQAGSGEVATTFLPTSEVLGNQKIYKKCVSLKKVEILHFCFLILILGNSNTEV